MKNEVLGQDIVLKGWGWEEVVTNQPLYCSKILVVNRGKKLSVHYHQLKTETFKILSGSVVITYYDDENFDKMLHSWSDVETGVLNGWLKRETLLVNDAFHIPVGLRHTVKGLRDSRILEISTQHFDSDSYRVLKGD